MGVEMVPKDISCLAGHLPSVYFWCTCLNGLSAVTQTTMVCPAECWKNRIYQRQRNPPLGSPSKLLPLPNKWYMEGSDLGPYNINDCITLILRWVMNVGRELKELRKKPAEYLWISRKKKASVSVRFFLLSHSWFHSLHRTLMAFFGVRSCCCWHEAFVSARHKKNKRNPEDHQNPDRNNRRRRSMCRTTSAPNWLLHASQQRKLQHKQKSWFPVHVVCNVFVFPSDILVVWVQWHSFKED